MKSERSSCGIARTLEILGDKWSLLIVRDLMRFDTRTFGELAELSEGISTHTLTERLKRLGEFGLIRRKPYQSHPVRYEYSLTKRGKALRPVILSMLEWAGSNLPRRRKRRSA